MENAWQPTPRDSPLALLLVLALLLSLSCVKWYPGIRRAAYSTGQPSGAASRTCAAPQPPLLCQGLAYQPRSGVHLGSNAGRRARRAASLALALGGGLGVDLGGDGGLLCQAVLQLAIDLLQLVHLVLQLHRLGRILGHLRLLQHQLLQDSATHRTHVQPCMALRPVILNAQVMHHLELDSMHIRICLFSGRQGLV